MGNKIFRWLNRTRIKPFLQLLFGISTYFPGFYDFLSIGTSGTNSARYCYSVWLRHLVMANKNGLSTKLDCVAELGPGDSIGIGLAALISSANSYYALDIVEHATLEKNVEIFDELVALFENREAIPDESEFPKVEPTLDSYEFPRHILTDTHLNEKLRKSRIDSIRNELLYKEAGICAGYIHYIAPWYDPSVIRPESVDMIFSQAVLEHVDDLSSTYASLYCWLKPGGHMSHEIDFKCHGTAFKWNGHWSYSNLIWKLFRGKRPYLLNREPHSIHKMLLEKSNFEVVCDLKIKTPSNIHRKTLAPQFSSMSDDDLTTSSAFIQAIKVG
jgi:hypothetical protein